MAVLSLQQLARISNKLARRGTVRWTKPVIYGAIQAIEDRLQSSKAILNSDIETAAPGVFTAQETRLIFANAAVRFALGEGAD